MSRRRAIGKLGIGMFELGASVVDLGALSLIRRRQENFVRKLYRDANELARLTGVPQKTYRRINSKGVVETVR